jgi:hypothetical protein
MNERDLQNRRTRSTQPGHEFETPIVKELPSEVSHSEREIRQTTPTQSEATVSQASTENRRFASRDAPPACG